MHMWFGIELASEHKDRAPATSPHEITLFTCHTAGVSIGGYAPERGHRSLHVVNIRLRNDTRNWLRRVPDAGNMADKFLRTTSSMQAPLPFHVINLRSTKSPPAVIDHNLYYSPPERRRALARGLRHGDGIDKYLESRDDLIRAFSIRIC